MSIYREVVQTEQLNKSTSKQMYSFGHQQRFRNVTKSLNDNFYEIPTTKSQRSAAFGYGNKFDFSKQSKQVPPPNRYQIKSQFDSSNSKGKTFGLARSQVKNNDIFQFNNKYPGPGTYQDKSTLSNISYSMRPQTSTGFLSKVNKHNPGPGTYEKIDSMSKTGKFPISKFKTYGVPIINPAHKNKGMSKSQLGPGAYHAKDELFQSVTSKFYAKRGFQIGRFKRETFANRNNTPGPGSYRMPSDFGHYEKTTKQLQNRR